MKKSFTRTYIIALICVFTCSMLLSAFSELPRSVCYFIAFLIYTIILLYDVVMQYKIQKILNEECDPNRYLAEWAKYENYKRSKSYKAAHLLNRSSALVNQGKYDEALRLIETIAPAGLNNVWKIIYFNNLMLVFLYTNELAKAKEYWNHLYTAKTPANLVATLEYNLMYADLMHFNPSDENRKLFIEKTEKIFSTNSKAPMIFKVAMHYAMGIAHFELSDMDKAKECFTYTIENGNKLHTVTLTQQYLERIDAF